MKHQDILDQLTLEQKVALLSGRDVWSTYPFPQAGVPSMFLSDGPHGVRKQLGEGDHLGLNASQPSTCFPTAAGIANSWDPELATQAGRIIGKEAACLQVNVLLGPGLNIKRSPLGGRNFEYYSEEPLSLRQNGCRLHPRRTGKRHLRLPQALCRQQPGAAAHDLRQRGGRAGPAGAVSHQL